MSKLLKNFLDYICLQELWDPADRQAVINALQSNYPYTVQAGPRNGTCTDPCSPTDSETVLNCLYTNDCLTSDNQLSCIANQCDVRKILFIYYIIFSVLEIFFLIIF